MLSQYNMYIRLHMQMQLFVHLVSLMLPGFRPVIITRNGEPRAFQLEALLPADTLS